MTDHHHDAAETAGKSVVPIDPTLVFITLPEVRRLCGDMSKSNIYADPTFPAPVSFSPPGRTVRRARWLKHEVVAWLRARIAQRDAMSAERRRRLIEAQERKRAKSRKKSARRIAATTA